MLLIEKIEAVLREAEGRWMGAQEIASHVYADRADGGPLSANNCIYNAIHKRRNRGEAKEIEGHLALGYRIKKQGKLK